MVNFLRKLLLFYPLLLLLAVAASILPNLAGSEVSLTEKIYTFLSAATLTGAQMGGNIPHYTFAGKLLVLCFIQLAAFWQMCFALAFIALTGNRNFIANSAQITVSQLIKKAAFYLLLFEAFSAVGIYAFSRNLQLEDTFFSAVFHGISVFTLSGFTLFENGYASPVFAKAYIFQLVLAGIICMSSLGYTVYFDLTDLQRLRNRMLQPQINWTKHTRFSIYAVASLVLTGIILFYLFERNNTLAGEKIVETGISSVVNICGAGGAGVYTFPTINLSKSAQWPLSFVMFAGTPFGGVAGGLSLTVIFLALTYLRKKNAYKALAKNALAVLIFSLLVITIAAFLLWFLNPAFQLRQIIFEMVSAFSNNGLSTGIYAASASAKIILTVLMVLGRFGTAAVAFLTYMRLSKNA